MDVHGDTKNTAASCVSKVGSYATGHFYTQKLTALMCKDSLLNSLPLALLEEQARQVRNDVLMRIHFLSLRVLAYKWIPETE